MIIPSDIQKRLDENYEGLYTRGYIPLFTSIIGSRLTGLYSAESDWDLRTVYAIPPHIQLSLNNSFKEILPQVKNENFDFQAMSLRHFLRGVQKASPHCLEILHGRHLNTSKEGGLDVGSIRNTYINMFPFAKAVSGHASSYLSIVREELTAKNLAAFLHKYALGLVTLEEKEIITFDFEKLFERVYSYDDSYEYYLKRIVEKVIAMCKEDNSKNIYTSKDEFMHLNELHARLTQQIQQNAFLMYPVDIFNIQYKLVMERLLNNYLSLIL